MTAIIEAHGLSKRYGAHLALDHADFTIQPGRIVGLIGPNGAGKTTAMRAILGLTPSSKAACPCWAASRFASAQR